MADNIRVNWGKLLSRILLYFVIVLICLSVVFCASSSMINELSRVLPLIYARGTTSITSFSFSRSALSRPRIS